MLLKEISDGRHYYMQWLIHRWSLLLATTIFFYALCLVATIIMGVFFCSGGCSRNIAFIIVNVILVIVMSICSILPKVPNFLNGCDNLGSRKESKVWIASTSNHLCICNLLSAE